MGVGEDGGGEGEGEGEEEGGPVDCVEAGEERRALV